MTALLLGIAGIFTLLPAPFAVGFGISALRRSRQPQTRGKGMAVTGLVLGVLGSIALAVVVITAAASPAPGSNPAASGPTATPSASVTRSPTPSPAATHTVVLTAAEQKFADDMHSHLRGRRIGSAALVGIGLHVCSQRRAGESQASVVSYLQRRLRGDASSKVARLAEEDLCHRYLPLPRTKPTKPPVVAESLCGAPANPYHLNLCGRGSLVYNPPPDVCNYFNCIANFPNGTGYMVECNDGTYSMSGGHQGACSYHDGEGTPVTQG